MAVSVPGKTFDSHQVPVESLSFHLTHQILQTALEENLKPQIVLDHQGSLQSTLDNLSIKSQHLIKTDALLTNPRLCLCTDAFYLLPDVVVGKKAAQLSFCERPAVVGVAVAWQHVNPQTVYLTHIHSSEKNAKIII